MRKFDEFPNLSHEIWRWTLNHSSSIGRRSHPAVVTLRGRLYVCGGFDGAERQTIPGFDGMACAPDDSITHSISQI